MHDDEGTDNKLKIFANIFISFIGAGILGLPYAFKEAGIIEGVAVMACVGALSVHAMLLIVDCKDKLMSGDSRLYLKSVEDPSSKKPGINGKAIDYGDVGFAAMGTMGSLLVDVSIVVSQVGFCCAYLIFISENLCSIRSDIPQLGYLFVLLVPLALLCNIRNLNNLAYGSIFADFVNVFAYGIVFYFDFENFHLLKYHVQTFSLEGLPFFIGISIYCYEGAGMILSLEGSVSKASKSSFRSVFKMALFSTTVLYILFGISGYLSFGPDTEGIITLNLPPGLFPFLVKACLSSSLFFTYPIMMFPVSSILERRLCSVDRPSTFWFGCVLRCGLVLVTGVVVILIPNFSTMMALVGSSCCTLLALILPGTFHLMLFKGKLTTWSRVLDILLILLGVIGTIIGSIDALHRLFGKTTGLAIVNGTDSASGAIS